MDPAVDSNERCSIILAVSFKPIGIFFFFYKIPQIAC